MIYIMDNFSLVNKSIICIAKRNSGKSELIKYLVKNSIKNNEFDKIFVFSTTNCVNEFYNSFICDKCIFSKYSEDWTNKLIDIMTLKNKGKTNQSHKPYNILILLDDMASDISMHQSESIKKLYTRGRHSFISIIVLGQQLVHVSPIMRNNSDYILCGQLNASNIEQLCDSYRIPLITKKEFTALYKELTNNYKFMAINNNTVKDSDNINSFYGWIKAEL